MIVHILLTIIKWIGILLLCVLGILLLLILAVLFVPVRYRLWGDIHGEVHARGCVSWLLHILHVSIQYDGGQPVIKLRVFGIPLLRGSAKGQQHAGRRGKQKENDPAARRTEDTDAGSAKENSGASDTADEVEEAMAARKEDAAEAEANGAGDAFFAGNENADAQTQLPKPGKQENESGKNKGLLAKLKGFLRFLRTIPRKIRAALQTIKTILQAARQAYRSAKDKVAFLRARIRHMWNWWQHPDTNKAVAHVKKELRYLWNHAKPRKYEASLVVGTDDPASTGELLGALGMAYAWSEGRLQVTPDFTEKRLEADFSMKGRLFGYQLLGIAIRLFLDEQLRSSLGKFRAE